METTRNAALTSRNWTALLCLYVWCWSRLSQLCSGCVQVVFSLFKSCRVSRSGDWQVVNWLFGRVWSVAYPGPDVWSSGLYIAALCTLPLYLTAGSPDWPPDLHRKVAETPPKRLSQFTSRHIAAFNTTWLFINLWLTVYRADASSRPRLSHSVSSYLQLTFTPSQLVPVASVT